MNLVIFSWAVGKTKTFKCLQEFLWGHKWSTKSTFSLYDFISTKCAKSWQQEQQKSLLKLHTHTTEQCTNSRPLKETIGTRFVTLCFKIHRYSYSRNNHILITVITKYVSLTIAKQSFLKTLWLMMMYHHTMFDYKRLNISEHHHLDKHSMKFEPFALTMDLNALKQSFYRTVDIPSKFGSKKISSLEDTIKTHLGSMSLKYDPDLEDSNPVFSLDILVHDDQASN